MNEGKNEKVIDFRKRITTMTVTISVENMIEFEKARGIKSRGKFFWEIFLENKKNKENK